MFNEEQLEDATLDIFESLGYERLNGYDLDRDYHSVFMEDTVLDNDVFTTKNLELNKELMDLENERRNILNSKMYIQKEEKRLKAIEKELSKSSTIHRFDDEVFKKLISKVIMGDYEEDGSYNPNVVKFVLNLKNISSEGNTKFLSLEVDERVF